jgi:hypothetical protein
MKKYRITFRTGTYESATRIVEVEDFECEQDALDKMIDELEAEGSEGYFLKWEDTTEEGSDHYEDEYIVGGNHGRILHHYGIFNIKEVSE